MELNVTNRPKALPSAVVLALKIDCIQFSGYENTQKALWLSWLERRPVTAEVGGSSPPGVVIVRNHVYGILAQLGEHLPYKQRVIGSSPIGPIEWLFMSVGD